MIDRDKLALKMTELLQAAVDEEAEEGTISVVSDSSSLLGSYGVVSSIGLVSYVLDVEAMLEEEYDFKVTLVNESALSRSQSPFRTVKTLTEYVLEVAAEVQGTPAQAGELAS